MPVQGMPAVAQFRLVARFFIAKAKQHSPNTTQTRTKVLMPHDSLSAQTLLSPATVAAFAVQGGQLPECEVQPDLHQAHLPGLLPPAHAPDDAERYTSRHDQGARPATSQLQVLTKWPSCL